jgi:prolyl oligopeptidase
MKHARCSKIFAAIACCGLLATGAEGPTAPPAAPVRPVTDEYFGIRVTDPYRYLENLKDPEVEAWFKQQNDYTRAVLARIPGREELLARIKMLDESASARVSDIRRLPGGRYFYMKRLATDDVAKLYTRVGLSGAETLLVDPMKLAAKGSHSALSYYAPSFDGRYVAYGVSAGGSEEAVLHVVETASGQETGDVIDRAQFGFPTWSPDGRSFFYNREQKLGPKSPPTDKELKSRVYLHKLGTDAESDREVLGFDHSATVRMVETDIPLVATIPGSSEMIGSVLHGVQNEITLFAAPLDSVDRPAIPWRKLCDVDDEVAGFAVLGPELYLMTHKDSSRYKVTRTSLAHPDTAHAEVVLPQGQAVIQNISAAQDGVYVQEMDGGVGRLVRIANGGKPETVALPFAGAVSVAASDQRLPGVLLDMTSWTKADQVYAYDPDTRQTTDTRLQPAGPFDDPADIESVEVKAPSYDGTMIPLSIVYKRGIKLDGSNPLLMIGYGAYGIPMDPGFDPKLLAWLERGGVYAIAHVRGGGEYGEEWHLAGKKLTKPNTWRDFIACGEYLVAQKYTSPAKMGIWSASAGGILIGRSITERPDLFAAAIDGVPCSDALRMESEPNGPPNVPEFGSSRTLEGFEDLYAMSAYHHIRDGVKYPAVMVMTGYNDPRVASWQAGKMAARLEAATQSGAAVLLRVDYDAGHGFGSTKTQRQVEDADEYSFLLWRFGVAGFQPR